MKKFILLLPWLGLSVLCAQVERQPHPIDTIYANEASSIILLFDEPISLVDLGTADFIAKTDQKVLMLKAVRPLAADSPLTTLFVRFGQEQYFTGFISYQAQPAYYYYDCRALYPKQRLRLNAQPDGLERLSLASPDTSLQAVEQHLGQLMDLRPEIATLGEIENHLELAVENIRNDDAATYLKLSLHNRSSMPYEVEFVGFRFREPTRGRELADILTEIAPLSFQIAPKVSPYEKEVFLFALPIYAMPRRASLEIIFREKNGSRSLVAKVPMNYILKAPIL
ncbi:MAG: DUF4138 domain-containing protein [Bacteroidota bacterium]